MVSVSTQHRATRPVAVTVTRRTVGWAIVDSYDLNTRLKAGRIFRVPLYLMRLAGRDDSGMIQYYDFKVIRFGVGHSGRGPDFIAGKSRDRGTHILTWRGKYMGGKGAWKLSRYRQVLIHDGADFPRLQAYGAVGCIEITRPRGWEQFNQRVRELSGISDLKEIGNQGTFKCQLLWAPRPRLARVR